MAVVGLQNVSSFFGEPQYPVSRASSILQMWRELEGDSVVSHTNKSRQPSNRTDSECSSTSMSMGQGSENGDDASEDANAVKNECERVRKVRKWVETSVHRGTFGDEVGSKIEKEHDGSLVSHPAISGRKPIRRICGRQTLVDLLKTAEIERKRELNDLSDRRPVSGFAHRSRIQALLRGRFLRNGISVPNERPSSRGATELGLLRQRNTVSDLRDGFLSKLDNSAPTAISTSESEFITGEEIDDELEPPYKERNVTDICTASDLESTAECQQEFIAQASEGQYPFLYNKGREPEVLLDFDGDHSLEAPISDSDSSEQEVSADAILSSRGYSEQIRATSNNDSSLETEDSFQSGGSHEVFEDHHSEARSVATYGHEANLHTANLEINENEECSNRQNAASSVVEEFQHTIYEMAVTEWCDGSEENMPTSLHESPTSQWFQAASTNNALEQESSEHWPTDDFQEAVDSWLDMPSEEVGLSVTRNNIYHFDDDDDNDQSVELRELVSRRRVSSLLRSSFRERLDQVLQSRVGRHIHNSDDWELDSTSTTIVDEEDEQPNGDQTLPLSERDDSNQFAPTSTLWDEEMNRTNGPHNLSHQFGTERDIINDLRIGMFRLQQRMSDMQSMLEACMEMQVELQHTVRQEVSAALNRSVLSSDRDASKGSSLHDDSMWKQVKNGICCVCSDATIDSMLYRCGHMCTCMNCAENMIRHSGKCPMCCAPVVEVARPSFLQ